MGAGLVGLLPNPNNLAHCCSCEKRCAAHHSHAAAHFRRSNGMGFWTKKNGGPKRDPPLKLVQAPLRAAQFNQATATRFGASSNVDRR